MSVRYKLKFQLGSSDTNPLKQEILENSAKEDVVYTVQKEV